MFARPVDPQPTCRHHLMIIPAPLWLLAEIRRARVSAHPDQTRRTVSLLSASHLPTVCENARCPNRGECYANGTATFLILGDVCTRNCAFCAVTHGKPPFPPDRDEPHHLAGAVNELGLRHVVITSVTRDDLPDGGARHYAAVITALRRICPSVVVEVLVPDFCGSVESLDAVLAAGPDIMAHNLETVPRLYLLIRRGADYSHSLALLGRAKREWPGITTKSGIMLGLGEEDREVDEVLHDLREAGCDMLTIGQYLAPSLYHAPVRRYLEPSEFVAWQGKATALGFRSVASGPLVRSSYHAPVFYEEIR